MKASSRCSFREMFSATFKLSAPSVAIFLRLRLRFSDAGEKSQRFLGPKSAPPLCQRALRFFLRRIVASDGDSLRFFEEKKRLLCGLAGDGTFATENRGDLRLRFLVLSALRQLSMMWKMLIRAHMKKQNTSPRKIGPTSDYWDRTEVARCAEEMTGICRDFQWLLTPCHTRLRRPPKGPFSYQGVSTRGVGHPPGAIALVTENCCWQRMFSSASQVQSWQVFEHECFMCLLEHEWLHLPAEPNQSKWPSQTFEEGTIFSTRSRVGAQGS